METMEEKSVEIAAAVSVCREIISKARAQTKRPNANLRYLVLRRTKYFLAIGTPAPLAKIGSELCYLLESGPDVTKGQLLAETECKEEQKFNMAKAWLATINERLPWAAIFTKMDSNLTERETSIVNKLSLLESKAMRGLYSQAKGEDIAAEMDKLPQEEYKAHKNTGIAWAPFALAFRKHTLRFGPQSWPLTGMGAFAVAKSSPVMVALLDIKPLMQKGAFVHMDHVPTALQQKSLKDTKWQMVKIMPSQALWIPFGCIALPAAEDEIACVRVFPWPSEMLKAGITDEEWELITTACLSFARRNSQRAPWSGMLEVLGEFLTPADRTT